MKNYNSKTKLRIFKKFNYIFKTKEHETLELNKKKKKPTHYIFLWYIYIVFRTILKTRFQ